MFIGTPKLDGYIDCGMARDIAMKKAAKSIGSSIPFLSKSVEQLKKEGYTYKPGLILTRQYHYRGGEYADICKEYPGKWIPPHINFIKKLPKINITPLPNIRTGNYGSYSMNNSKKKTNEEKRKTNEEEKRLSMESKIKYLKDKGFELKEGSWHSAKLNISFPEKLTNYSINYLKDEIDLYERKAQILLKRGTEEYKEDLSKCQSFMDKYNEEDKVLGQSGGTRKKRRRRRPSKSLKKRRS